MSSPSSGWFPQGTDPGTIITLDQPVPSHEEIRRRHGHYSYATAKLLCCDPKKPYRRAFMRVYLQVPFKDTEIQDPKTRSRQATTYAPLELTSYQKFTQQDFSNVPKLLGYKVSTQDKSGLVPNGFATWLAWEMVPGLRLGDKFGNDPYWTLSAVEREHVCMAFMKALPQALEKGYGPYTPSLLKLVCYFIGYFYGINDEPKDRRYIKISLEALARYGLAKPSSNEWRNKNWNGDTTGWKM
ncbi:hypothetical protein N7539_007404 [Penicillium diatomitis]|uniref:Uncharacterized protein n=1 Tax=Penicillium diatomitis TaxID=2819901 RepID=A0A9X0BNW0_9EURO|nr:uncharacterized protein N7539_007404 [Penicillium diatomitis]KAJ5477260.1 hypothetical protein N7539_007404 [Penicillium diatomitis]